MDPYASAGVDEEREQDVFARAMRPWLARTTVRSPLVTHITGLASGYFATMMHIPPGPPLALTTDGVGTKILLAREANRWEPIGIDCVANNVNDVICTGAVPLARPVMWVTSGDLTVVRASHGRIARANTSCSRSSSTPALA